MNLHNATNGHFLNKSDDMSKAIKGIEVMLVGVNVNTHNLSDSTIRRLAASAETTVKLYGDRATLKEYAATVKKMPTITREKLENDEGVVLYALATHNPEVFKKLREELVAAYAIIGFSRLTKAIAYEVITK